MGRCRLVDLTCASNLNPLHNIIKLQSNVYSTDFHLKVVAASKSPFDSNKVQKHSERFTIPNSSILVLQYFLSIKKVALLYIMSYIYTYRIRIIL